MLFIDVVPVVAPRLRVVAAPPIDKLVALVLNNVAVAFVVVRSPPFKARSPDDVISPVNVDAPSIVKVPLADILPVFVIVTPVEP